MLLQCFGFNKDPFGSTPDPRCLYHSKTHREALASLKYGFYSNRGFTALIAPPGMGKTTLLNCFLDDIRGSARTVFLFNVDSECKPWELLGFILRDIGIIPKQSNAEMHDQLNEAVAAEARIGRILTIVIDEAQNLSDAALEKIRMLTNFETPTDKLIQIVLAGQPQLSDRLMQPSLTPLRQRISTICRLEPLSAEETRAYIGHHLELAGYKGGALFTSDALKLIEEASQGIPRIINNVCFNALSLCRALKKSQVDVSVVAEVITDQQLMAQIVVKTATPAKARAGRSDEYRMPVIKLRNGSLVVAAEVLLACMLGAFGLSELSNRRSQPGDVRTLPPKVNSGSKPQLALEPDQTHQGVTKQLRGDFNQKRIDSAYIKAEPKVLANTAMDNEPATVRPAELAIQETVPPGTGSTTTGQTAPKVHIPPETMNDQPTAAARIPSNSETEAQPEAPPAGGGGEFSLSGPDARDVIGRIFPNRRGSGVKPETPKAVMISAAVAEGLLIKKIAPLYPIFAKEARVAGEVLLQLTISETGSVESLQVLRGPIALRQAAIDAVKSWRFKPYIVNSEPTAADTKVSVLFKLSR